MTGGRSLVAVGCVLMAMLAGCGDASEPARDETQTAAARPPAPAPPTPEQRLRERQRRAERHLAPNPFPRPTRVRPHPRARVERVTVHDVKLGRGPALGRDEDLWGEYIQAYYRSGQIYYGDWGRAVYMTRGGASAGFNRGVVGMRPGGRRVIVIPRDLADVHDPDGTGWEIGYVDVVLRSIVPMEP